MEKVFKLCSERPRAMINETPLVTPSKIFFYGKTCAGSSFCACYKFLFCFIKTRFKRVKKSLPQLAQTETAPESFPQVRHSWTESWKVGSRQEKRRLSIVWTSSARVNCIKDEGHEAGTLGL